MNAHIYTNITNNLTHPPCLFKLTHAQNKPNDKTTYTLAASATFFLPRKGLGVLDKKTEVVTFWLIPPQHGLTLTHIVHPRQSEDPYSCTRGKFSSEKTPFQPRDRHVKGQKQGRNEKTPEHYPTME